MTTKLHINILQGIVDIEGDPDLVREIYADFKDQLLESLKAAPAQPAATPAVNEEPSDNATGKQKAKRRSAPKKKASGDEAGSGVIANAPKLDKNLDTSALPGFYAAYEPKSNYEKILIFLKFLTEKAEIENPNTDQVFTCFRKVGEKIPKAFAQAFHDTSTKHGYIDYNSSTDIKITIAGENHLSHGMKKKPAE